MFMDKKLQDALKKANTEVEQAGITDPELKKIAFSKAVDFYLQGDKESLLLETDVLKTNRKRKWNFWGNISSTSGVEIKRLKDLYSIKDEQILLVVSSVPGKSKAERQRNLAILILFAYHEGFEDEWIPANLLAEAAKHSRLYDTSKFAKNLKTNWFRSEGVRRGLKYKLSGPGISAAKTLLTSLTQNDE